MKSVKFNATILVALVFGFALLTQGSFSQTTKKPWNVPAKYKEMKNPQKQDNAAMVTLGKNLFAKHCKACHGATGLGDGPKAKQLKTYPGDFSKPDFHKLSDGELYYMAYVGRDEMPNFEKKITDEEERWAIITYMRKEFKK
jgi:mono/diheme cytochrome c family protein